ncbi:TetR/AcrR family transcriptional regulator [soil metagenome]
MAVAVRKNLGINEWCYGALRQIAAGGPDSVSVEGLARDLGVTKGSFYWHFADRAALISSALEYWAEAATDRTIDDLGRITDPRRRLRALFRTAATDDRSRLDVMLATSTGDPGVAMVVERVTGMRLRFLVDAYCELGWSRTTAERQSLIAYAAYIGHVQLAHALGPDVARRRMGPAYLDQIIATLVPPAPPG